MKRLYANAYLDSVVNCGMRALAWAAWQQSQQQLLLLLEFSPRHYSTSSYCTAGSAHMPKHLKAASISTAPASVLESSTCCCVSVSDLDP
jgi:hypothetical protein